MLQGLTMWFPSVYVQVRQLGAWKLHPYNSIALIDVVYNHPYFAQSAHVLATNLEFCGHDSNDNVIGLVIGSNNTYLGQWSLF